MQEVVNAIPSCQIGVFSAGYESNMEDYTEFTRKFMKNSLKLSISPRRELTLHVTPFFFFFLLQQTNNLQGIENFYIDVQKPEWKFDTLMDLLDTLPLSSCTIFCSTHRKAEWLTEQLTSWNFTAASTVRQPP